MSEDQDRYIGETYLSKDKRTTNRRIRIKGRGKPGARGVTRYTAVVVTDEGNPAAVGRYVLVQPLTLDRQYTKVSH